MSEPEVAQRDARAMCSMAGCSSWARARGYCGAHYARMRREVERHLEEYDRVGWATREVERHLEDGRAQGQ